MVKVRIGAVVAEFNYDITHMMLELAKEHAKFLDSEITEVITVARNHLKPSFLYLSSSSDQYFAGDSSLNFSLYKFSISSILVLKDSILAVKSSSVDFFQVLVSSTRTS